MIPPNLYLFPLNYIIILIIYNIIFKEELKGFYKMVFIFFN